MTDLLFTHTDSDGDTLTVRGSLGGDYLLVWTGLRRGKGSVDRASIRIDRGEALALYEALGRWLNEPDTSEAVSTKNVSPLAMDLVTEMIQIALTSQSNRRVIREEIRAADYLIKAWARSEIREARSREEN